MMRYGKRPGRVWRDFEFAEGPLCLWSRGDRGAGFRQVGARLWRGPRVCAYCGAVGARLLPLPLVWSSCVTWLCFPCVAEYCFEPGSLDGAAGAAPVSGYVA
jgi:hypothetical protein